MAGHAADRGRADRAGVGLPGRLRPVGAAGRRPGRPVLEQLTPAPPHHRTTPTAGRHPATRGAGQRHLCPTPPPRHRTSPRRPPPRVCRPAGTARDRRRGRRPPAEADDVDSRLRRRSDPVRATNGQAQGTSSHGHPNQPVRRGRWRGCRSAGSRSARRPGGPGG